MERCPIVNVLIRWQEDIVGINILKRQGELEATRGIVSCKGMTTPMCYSQLIDSIDCPLYPIPFISQIRLTWLVLVGGKKGTRKDGETHGR